MENAKLKIKDYIISCIDFENSQDESKLKEIQSFIDALEFREYIPLKEKEIIILKIMSKVGRDYDAPGAAAMIEMSKIVLGLFAYCINLERDVEFLETLYYCHDLFYQFGLIDAIMQHCGEDYKRLVKMLDKALSFDNLYRLMQTTSLFDTESYDKWLKTMNDLKTAMDQDTLKEFVKITNSEDPTSQEVLREANKIALDVVNEEILHDKQKVENAIEIFDNQKQQQEEKEEVSSKEA